MDTYDRTADDLYAEYRADYLAAMDPCLDCTLRACPEDDRRELAARIETLWVEQPSPPYSPVQNARRTDRGRESLARMFARNPGFVARLDQAEAEAVDGMRARFDALPWHVRRWRRLRWPVWERWFFLRVRLRQRFGTPPYERVSGPAARS